jgi:uncharacterized protein
MDPLELLRQNLLSPVVLAFVLGVVAVLVRSDLRLPADLYTVLAVYLLFAIGLKGGAALSVTPFSSLWAPALATLVLGVVIPLFAYAILRRLGRFSVVDAAAIAAHYGSVSAVTFTAAMSALQSIGVEGFMPALVAILEVPAILIALGLARSSLASSGSASGGGSMAEIWRELLVGRSLFVLIGGVIIGLLSGQRGLQEVSAFFVEPFKGALVLFMLEMGMVAAARLRDLRKAGLFLVVFGIVMPLVQGALGVSLGTLAGLSVGGASVLGVMAASASYIAAPAAVRIALPQANPAFYLGSSLGVMFPFNLSVGIPFCVGQLDGRLDGGQMNTSIQTVTLKRVTIIAESLLEARLLADLERLGAKGFTITEARGRGSRGVRASEWEGQNLKLETIVSPEVADRIMMRMVESYFPNYAVIAYLENVEVVRGEKYV